MRRSASLLAGGAWRKAVREKGGLNCDGITEQPGQRLPRSAGNDAAEGATRHPARGAARRRATRPLSVVSLALTLLLAGSAAQGQRLLTLVPGVSAASSADGRGPSIGPLPMAVRVDLELLRGDPAWLEVPTPEGETLSAERSVFEDRGNGDLMWSGGQPGAGYDTVVLTVEGGRLVGRFGAAGGGVYQIHADRAGRGGMAAIVGDLPEGWCGAEEADAHAAHEHDHSETFAAGLAAADAPAARRGAGAGVSSPESPPRLDILVRYTATAAENWAWLGGAEAAIRHAGDYLKMVFRNSRIGVEPHIVHIAEAPARLDRIGRDLGRHEFHGWRRGSMLRLYDGHEGDWRRLRREHRADLLYLFAGESPYLHDGVCGQHSLLRSGKDPAAYGGSGWSSNHPFCPDYAVVFAHEIGHGLGAHHDPPHVPGFLHPDPAGQFAKLFRPYALAHVNYDVMPSLGTAVSYEGQIEPFYSSSSVRPWGAVIGVPGGQDNERTLRETAPLKARSGESLPTLEGLPAQPTGLQARFEGEFARLTWRDNAPDADRYEIDQWVAWDEGGIYLYLYDQPADGRTGSLLTLPPESMVAGARHEFRVSARKGDVQSLSSTRVFLVFPGDPIAAPSGVSVTVDDDLGQVDVTWTDNSDNETGFDVQLLHEGEPVLREWAPADATEPISPFYDRSVRPRQGDEYGVRVVAYNKSGQSESSETVTFRWDHPLAARPPDPTAVAIGPTTVRVTWTVDPKVAFYRVDAQLEGWASQRHWHPGDPESDGRAWMDFEGLARGGRYTFAVDPIRRSGPDSLAYLTLGERGPGPRPPSDLSLVTEGELMRLSWKDNSDDELGFEVQMGTISQTISDGQDWLRAVVVPRDTESVVFRFGYGFAGPPVLRVFAYNDRGYSVSSPLTPKEPGYARVTGLTSRSGDGEARWRWQVVLPEHVTSVQVYLAPDDWRLGDPIDDWKSLPASARAFTATGLKNDAHYLLAVRVVTANGPSEIETETAIPREGRQLPPLPEPALSHQGPCRPDLERVCLQDSRFEVKAQWWRPKGASGAGLAVPEGTDDSGLFRFFDSRNWEVLIKVLDGCANNGHIWVLGASTTDLGYRISVTDTVTGERRQYENQPGRPAPAIVDNEAFSAPCAGRGGR